MLRPKAMSKVLIVGPKGRLDGVIDALYEARLFHIVDHVSEDEDVPIGSPRPRGEAASEALVKLRSISSILGVKPGEGEATEEGLETLREKVLTLELNISEEEEARQRTQELLADLNARIEALRPFAALRLPLEAYGGYESIEILVGTTTREVEGLESVAKGLEVVRGPGALAVFVDVKEAEAVSRFLAEQGVTRVEIPDGSGDPRGLLKDLERDRSRWEQRLESSEERLAVLQERYARFILSAEVSLSREVEKADAPLRCASTEHSFVIEGWVPKERLDGLNKALGGMEEVYHSLTEAGEDEVPVELDNPKPVRSTEFLIHLFSTPNYKEIDPTIVVFLIFPIFFGLMIGDLGYGIVMLVLTAVLQKKLSKMPEFSDLLRVMFFGGIWAALFGVVLFGEAFGIPFVHEEGGLEVPITWEEIFGAHWDYHPVIEKLGEVGVVDMLLLSVIASFFHLGVGFIFGFVNEVRHDKKHALAKFGWLLVLYGLFTLLMKLPQNLDSYPVSRIFIESPLVAWIPMDPGSVLVVGSLSVSYFSIAFLAAGIALVVPAEGGVAVLEHGDATLLANMVSYTRIAGVAVAKGAVALAFNSMILGSLVLTGNIALMIVGFVLLFFAHAMVFLLGAISAGIQAIRLNYVEFFLKFFKGSGLRFSPFGLEKRAVQEA